MNIVRTLKKRIKQLQAQADSLQSAERRYGGKPLSDYRDDPEGYATHVLKVQLTPDQLELCKLLITSPYRVICRAGHIVGKSFIAAFMVNWIFDTRPRCFIITTAPKLANVRNIVWREIRKQRQRAGLGGFTGPRSIRLETSPEHVAEGMTALNATGFQGIHEVEVFIIMDEAAGIKPEFWEASETMLSGESYGMFAILNPTTTACQAYREEQLADEDEQGNPRKRYHVHVLSALDHPNIRAELLGQRPPYPAAVRLATLRSWIKKWCDLLLPGEGATEFDFQFPPKSPELPHGGRWYRPGPVGEARILGRYPRASVDTIWNEPLLDKCLANRLEIEKHWLCTMGVDVGRYGDDPSEIMVRIGKCVVHHEAHHGWDGAKLAGRVKQLCHQFAPSHQDPRTVNVFVDETGGWGSGCIDNAWGYNFIGVNVSLSSTDPETYFKFRTELWFQTVEFARMGLVDLSRLPSESRHELKRQLMAQKYTIRGDGTLWAVDKDDIKKELGRSPDTADALNLCFLTDFNPREHREIMEQ